jgi:hypothetical protein
MKTNMEMDTNHGHGHEHRHRHGHSFLVKNPFSEIDFNVDIICWLTVHSNTGHNVTVDSIFFNSILDVLISGSVRYP